MLILKAVSLGPLHGYGVLLRIQQISGEQLRSSKDRLYPALYRLEHQGLISSEWGESDNKRKAKFYSLTTTGRRQLHSETEKWKRMTVSDRQHSAHDAGGNMKLFARLRSWFKWIVKRTRLESEMEAEVRFHIESYAADLIHRGVPEPGSDAAGEHRVRRHRVAQRCDACIAGPALVG